MELNIKKRKIIYKSKWEIMRRLRNFELIGSVKDKIGIFGWLWKDSRSRLYLSVAKRYIFFQKDGTGIVSVNKKLINDCIKKHWYLLMYIEAEDKEYIYSISARVAKAKTEFENYFNKQPMLNFNILKNGINMLPTRTKTHQLEKYLKMGVKK